MSTPSDKPGSATERRRARARVRFDAVDLAILEQLQTDSKITNAMLAQRVGISPASMIERVKKLEASGIIRGYVAILEPAEVEKSMSAIVSVTLREHGEQRLREFTGAIEVLPEVQAAWHTTGEEDFILRVIVTDMAQYEDFVVHRLSTIPNIARVRTSFCLSTLKDTTRVPLDAVRDTDGGLGDAK
jgi:Lrp/AsnC family transcriptional regulator, leucine-responsive regulatory protein